MRGMVSKGLMAVAAVLVTGAALADDGLYPYFRFGFGIAGYSAPRPPDIDPNWDPGTGDLELYAARYARARPGVPFRFPARISDARARQPVTWTSEGAPLPAGFALDPFSGVVGGMSSEIGAYEGLLLQATDAAGRAGQTRPFTIEVVQVPQVSVGSRTVEANEGLAVKPSSAFVYGSSQWSLSGNLPVGLNFDTATGAISGATDQVGENDGLVVSVVDADGARGASDPFLINVVSDIRIKGVGGRYAARLAEPFAGIQPQLEGSSSFIEWSLAAGKLPEGMFVDPQTGAVTGTPTVPGSYETIALRARNKLNGHSVSSPYFQVDVDRAPQALVDRDSYVFRFEKYGAMSPRAVGVLGGARWLLDSGTLPPGLEVEPNSGAIRGTATAKSPPSPVRLRLVDLYDGKQAFSRDFTVSVVDLPVIDEIPQAYAEATVPFLLPHPVARNIVGTPTWRLVGKLPKGLSFDPVTGAISGTAPDPTDSPVPLSVQVVDGYDNYGSEATPMLLTVIPKGGLAVGNVRTAYEAATSREFRIVPKAVGAVGPVTWSMPGIPGWATLDTATGVLNGVPDKPADYSGLSFVAMTRTKTASSVAFGIKVLSPLSLSYGAGVGREGEPFNLVATVRGARGKAYFATVGGGMPPGLSLDPLTGTISGVPGQEGFYPVRVAVTDDATTSAPFEFSIQVLSGKRLASINKHLAGAVGTTFSALPDAGGQVGKVTWALESGTLPAWAAVTPGTGEIVGLPTAVGFWDGLSLSVTDGAGVKSTTNPFDLTVTPKPVLSASRPDIVTEVNAPLNVEPTVTGAKGSMSWFLSGGTLPAGLSFDLATGAVRGKGTVVAKATGLVATVIDGSGAMASSDPFSVDVRPSTMEIQDIPDLGAVVGLDYKADQPKVSGGAGTKTFALSSGTLPGWALLDGSTGIIYGKPDDEGVAKGLVMQVVDANGNARRTAPFTLTTRRILAAEAEGGTAVVFAPFSLTPKAVNAKGATTWSLKSGTLPPGLAVDAATGVVSGKPTVIANYPGIVLAVGDAFGNQAATPPFAIDVTHGGELAASVTDTSGYVGVPMQVNAVAANTRGRVAWAKAKGKLPDTLTLDTDTGAITGTPTEVGIYPEIVLMVRDEARTQATTEPFDVVVTLKPVLEAHYGDQTLSIGKAFTSKATATTAVGKTTWTLAAGAWPAGVTLDPDTGAVSGTPTDTGKSAGLVLRVKDGSGKTADSKPFSMTVGRPALAATGVPPIETHIGVALTGPAPTSANALGAVAWGAKAGFPAGLGVDPATGAVNGTASGEPSDGSYAVVATDGYDGTTAEVSQPIKVLGPPTVTMPPVLSVRQGQPFKYMPKVDSAIKPLAWSMASGAFPAPVTVDPLTGEISGTPPRSGLTEGLAVKVVDGQRQAGTSSTFSFEVVTGLGLTMQAPTYKARVGTKFSSGGPTVAGATGAMTFALASGTLPPGLRIDPASGSVEGTPTSVSTAVVSVGGTDSIGEKGVTKTFTVAVAPAPVPTYPDTTLRVGAPLKLSPSVANAVGKLRWNLVTGTLPPWAPLDPESGTLLGRPDKVGAFPGIVVGVLDEEDAFGQSKPFTLTATTGLGVSGLAPAYDGRVGLPLDPLVVPRLENLKGTASWVAKEGFPAGLQVDPATGVVSGTPTEPFLGAGTLVATDSSDGARLDVPVSFRIIRPLKVTASGFSAHQGQAAATPPPAVVGQRGPSLDWTSTGTPLPSWAAVNGGTGSVATPAAKETVTGVKVRARDVDGAVAESEPFDLTVLPEPYVSNVATSYTARYGFPFQAVPPVLTNGIGAVRWEIGSGTLPAWASLNPDGSMVGDLPDALGVTRGLTLVGTDSTGAKAASVEFSLGVHSQPSVNLSIASLSQKLRVGDAYELVPTARGVAGVASWSVAYQAGSLPAGLSMPDPSTGVISGTVAGSGNASFAVVVTDSGDGSTGQSEQVQVVAGRTLTLGAIPDYKVHVNGTFIRTPAPVTDGVTGTPSYDLQPSGLPQGMTGFDPRTGVLSGLPSAPYGPQDMKLTLTDSWDGRKVSTTFKLTVVGQLQFSGVPSQALAMVGKPFALPAVLQNAVGNAPVVLTRGGTDIGASLGSLCPGLSFANGTVSGTATASCNPGTLALSATDETGARATASFTLTAYDAAIDVADGSSSTVTVQEGSFGQVALATTIPNPRWTVTGSPPPGAGVDKNVLSFYGADVSSPQNYAFAVSASDGTNTVSKNVTATVVPATVTITPTATMVRAGDTYGATAVTDMTAPGYWYSEVPYSPLYGGVTPSNGSDKQVTLTGRAYPDDGGTTPRQIPIQASYSANTTASGSPPGKAIGIAYVLAVPSFRLAQPAQGLYGVPGTAVNRTPPPVVNLVGTASYRLMQGSTDLSDTLGDACPGLGFSRVTGVISGTPTRSCLVSNVSYVVQDGGDGKAIGPVSVTSGAFDTRIESNFSLTSNPAGFQVQGGKSAGTSVSVGGAPVLPLSARVLASNPSAGPVPAWMTAPCSDTACTMTASPPLGIAEDTPYPSQGAYYLEVSDASGTKRNSTGAVVTVAQDPVRVVAASRYVVATPGETVTVPAPTVTGGYTPYAYTVVPRSGTLAVNGPVAADGSFSFTAASTANTYSTYALRAVSANKPSNAGITEDVYVYVAEISSPDSLVVTEGDRVTFPVSAFMPDGTTIMSGQNWLTQQGGQALGYAPHVESDTVYTYVVTATSPYRTLTKTVTVTVKPDQNAASLSCYKPGYVYSSNSGSANVSLASKSKVTGVRLKYAYPTWNSEYHYGYVRAAYGSIYAVVYQPDGSANSYQMGQGFSMVPDSADPGNVKTLDFEFPPGVTTDFLSLSYNGTVLMNKIEVIPTFYGKPAPPCP